MPGDKGGMGEKGFAGEDTYGMFFICHAVEFYFFLIRISLYRTTWS